MREGLTFLLAVVLASEPTASSVLAAEPRLDSPEQGAPARSALKEKALKLPPQSFVEVSLVNHHNVKGRLAEITDEGLTLQVLQGDKIELRAVRFDDVKSIKARNPNGSPVGKAVLWGLAGFGALSLTVVLLCSAGCD
jgi:hypothetical protein